MATMYRGQQRDEVLPFSLVSMLARELGSFWVAWKGVVQ